MYESAEVHSASSENIAESGEDILHRHTSGTVETATTGTAEALRTHVVSELVVFGAFIGIGKHVVGLGRLLELLFSFFVVGVAVGVIFYGESAVGFLQLLGCGRFTDAKHFIVISFLSHFDKSLGESVPGITGLPRPLHGGAPCR